ncbi:MAG: hypothetical protein ACR2RF_02630 [Geminicoccaceae bacterium]
MIDNTSNNEHKRFTNLSEQGQIRVAELSARWGAFKAIGVAVSTTTIVGVFATVLGNQFQNSQIKIEEEKTKRTLDLEKQEFDSQDKLARREQERAYLQAFMEEALGPEIPRRVDFAEYVSQVTLDSDIRKAWTKYHAELTKKT